MDRVAEMDGSERERERERWRYRWLVSERYSRWEAMPTLAGGFRVTSTLPGTIHTAVSNPAIP